MNEVRTPDGYGQVLRTESSRGRTSYFVKGAGFEGWYDGLQVVSDFLDNSDDFHIDHENDTVLPYPSRPQGPGWDGSTSTIQPDIDPHLEMGGASDSLTGEPTSEDPVEADIEGLFEPHSRLAGSRLHHTYNASSSDPILDVSAIPDDSPVGLKNSPINPDNVDTDDLFGDKPMVNLEYQSATYDRLVIEDGLSFLKYADDEDDKKKNNRERDGISGFPKDSDDDNDDDDDSDDKDSDDDSSSDGDSSDSGDSDGGDSGGDGGSSGGHTAASVYALTTTADLHFLANMCSCDESLPLHSKSEHREMQAEAATHVDGVTPQPRNLEELHERYEQDQLFHPAPLDLVDHSEDDGDSADLYNHYASVGKHSDGYDKYIGGGDGHYYLIASGNGKLPKGEHYGHYDTYEDAHSAVEAIIARNHVHGSIKTAAPAADPGPTQIESQIEQLMQFWAVDNNGWWHWTGSQADLALLNQMQQQMMAVGMPGGPPGQQMQAQSSVAKTSVFEDMAPGSNVMLRYHMPMNQNGHYDEPAIFDGMTPEGRARLRSPDDSETGYSWEAYPYVDDEYGMPDRTKWAYGSSGEPLEVLHHEDPYAKYASFALESNTPTPWRQYLRTIASDRLVALAAWADVVQKSKRLRAEGAIDLEVFKPDVITAYVQGDNGRYYTTVQRLGSVPGAGRQLTSTQVSGWSCECEWGHWAWLRKRSFVGRMCSHAYALFSEMRSLDAKAKKNKGKPLSAGKFASMSKVAWTRTSNGGFEWVSNDPTLPTAAISRTASGWSAEVWSDGTAEDSLNLGTFKHSKYALRAVGRTINAHVKLAADGDVDLVGGSKSSDDDDDPYGEDGSPEPVVSEDGDQKGSSGVQESSTRTGSVFVERDDGQDDEGPETEDDGIEEEDPDDEESLDEEIAEDEGDSDNGDDDEDDGPVDTADDNDDGGHDEPHRRDDDDEGTDNPGDESDDDGIEKTSDVHPPDLTKADGPHHDNQVSCDNCGHPGGDHDVVEPHGKCLYKGCKCPGWDDEDHPDTDKSYSKHSSVAELQAKFGLSHLAGANYSLSEQDRLVREGDGKTARNRGDLNLSGTHYEAKSGSAESPEDTLAFLF